MVVRTVLLLRVADDDLFNELRLEIAGAAN